MVIGSCCNLDILHRITVGLLDGAGMFEVVLPCEVRMS